MRGSPLEKLPGMQVKVTLDQQPDHRAFAEANCIGDRSLTVRTPYPRVCPMFEQDSDDLRVAQSCCFVKRGIAIGTHEPGVGAVLD